MLNKYSSNLMLFILVAVIAIQANFQEQYKFNTIDLLFIPSGTVVECVDEGPGVKFPFFTPTVWQVSHLTIPYPISLAREFFMVRAIYPIQTKYFSPEYQTTNPFIKILYKNHISHSSSNDEGFNIIHCG